MGSAPALHVRPCTDRIWEMRGTGRTSHSVLFLPHSLSLPMEMPVHLFMVSLFTRS